LRVTTAVVTRAVIRCSYAAVAIAAALVWPVARLAAQSVTVSVAGEALHVHAPGFAFIKGEPLARLKDGRTVRVDLELFVLPEPGAAAVAQSRQTFVLSYDLWEERFAVTHVAAPSQSISHVTSAAAESWCLNRLSVPLNSLGRLGRDVPFWVRLQYRIQSIDAPPAADAADSFTLRALIDALSRRRRGGDLMQSQVGGPFRIPQ
jgi:hypothetical protein